jgi:phospholipase C
LWSAVSRNPLVGPPRWLLPAALAAIAAGCGGGRGGSAIPADPPSRAPRDSPITHVVIIVQENRTVDNLFYGFPGADTAKSGENSKGKQVPLRPVSMIAPYDISHSHTGFLTEYADGRMNGFDLVHTNCTHRAGELKCGPRDERAYAYVPRSEIRPYWVMAKQYTLADELFETNQGPSFPAHQYLVSGTSTISNGSPLRASEEPRTTEGKFTGGCDSRKGSLVSVIDEHGKENQSVYPCFDRTSLMALANDASVSWRYYQARPYAGAWHAPDAVKPIRQSVSFDDVVAPSARILTDVAKGTLANIVWVTPTAHASDHAGITDGSGPSWVASVVNAIGTSRYWDSAAIFILWDDWGGWYDHVKPQIYNSFELGFRVPLVVVSPYAKTRHISHKRHELASILRFTEETFGLPSLGTTDARADDLSDCFDFHAQPHRFRRIPSKYSAEYFLQQPHSNQAPDD